MLLFLFVRDQLVVGGHSGSYLEGCMVGGGCWVNQLGLVRVEEQEWDVIHSINGGSSSKQQ
jgi:hypothetical protein